MDYQVSARKYRPGTFDDVIGQSHVVQTLMNSIATKRIAHAFLFSGTRGVGKTTVARILAKALNCEQGPTGSPCNTCANCQEITQGTSVDVVDLIVAPGRARSVAAAGPPATALTATRPAVRPAISNPATRVRPARRWVVVTVWAARMGIELSVGSRRARPTAGPRRVRNFPQFDHGASIKMSPSPLRVVAKSLLLVTDLADITSSCEPTPAKRDECRPVGRETMSSPMQRASVGPVEAWWRYRLRNLPLCVLLAAAAAFLAFSLGGTSTATSSIYLTDPRGVPIFRDGTTAAADLLTYAQQRAEFVRSDDVLTLAAADLANGSDIQDLRSKVAATVTNGAPRACGRLSRATSFSSSKCARVSSIVSHLAKQNTSARPSRTASTRTNRGTRWKWAHRKSTCRAGSRAASTSR